MKFIYVGNGINVYAGMPTSSLSKCCSDVKRLSSILSKFGYICYTYFDNQCTKSEIMAHWKSAVASVRPDETAWLVIHQSSHGTQVPDLDGDEPDKADEAFVCHDTVWNGVLNRWDNVITDDEIKLFLNSLSNNITVCMVADTCHSGTITRDLVNPVVSIQKNRKFIYPRNFVTLPIKSRGDDSSGFIEVPDTRHILLAGASSSTYSYEDSSGGVLTTSVSKLLESSEPYLPTRRELIDYVIKYAKSKGFNQLPHYECRKDYMDLCAFDANVGKVKPVAVSRSIWSWFGRLFSFF
jgi:hypothetical protein